MSGAVEGVARDALNHHDQMLDAQAGCVSCKLCGGKAIITDAGIGAGYYIQCRNSLSFRDHRGCMLDGRRSGGWAYNVMDWWNRLHAVTTPPARSYADEDVTERADLIATLSEFADGIDRFGFVNALGGHATTLRAAIRLLSQGGKA